MDNQRFSIACQAARENDLRAVRYKTETGEQRIMLTYGGPKMAKLHVDNEKAALWCAFFYPEAKVVTIDGWRFIVSI